MLRFPGVVVAFKALTPDDGPLACMGTDSCSGDSVTEITPTPKKPTQDQKSKIRLKSEGHELSVDPKPRTDTLSEFLADRKSLPQERAYFVIFAHFYRVNEGA